MRETSKTLLFAAAVCITCSLLLSGTAAGLSNRQKANEQFDKHRNIVKAFGMDISAMERPEIETVFEKHVTSRQDDGLLLYSWTDNGVITKYAIPISGKGLWSTLRGYLALEADLETIAGISFYEQKETPGLGAEIVKDSFANRFAGKKIYAAGAPTAFKVVKPGTPLDTASVDGISGATLTGNGVQALLRKDAAAYADCFNRMKEN